MSSILNPIIGGGSSLNILTVLVDFGFDTGQEGDVASALVVATWVTSSSMLVCTPQAVATVDHDPDDYACEGITAYAENIVPGVGFTVIASAQPNNTWGKYYISVVGK